MLARISAFEQEFYKTLNTKLPEAVTAYKTYCLIWPECQRNGRWQASQQLLKRASETVSWWGWFPYRSNKLTCRIMKRFNWDVEKCHTIARSYQGFYGRKPLLRNLLQFFDGAEKHRSKGDLTDIRHLNSPKLLRTTVSKALWKGKGKKMLSKRARSGQNRNRLPEECNIYSGTCASQHINKYSFWKGGKVNIEVVLNSDIIHVFQDDSTFQRLVERFQDATGLSNGLADVAWFWKAQNDSNEQKYL